MLFRSCQKPLSALPVEQGPGSYLDYHVEVDHHFNIVPHCLVGEPLEVRATATTIAMSTQGKLGGVPSPVVSGGQTQHLDGTDPQGASGIRQVDAATDRRLGGATKAATAAVVEQILSRKTYSGGAASAKCQKLSQ